MKPHMMVDIETMGMTPDGVIAQLGWATFDPRDGRIITTNSMNVEMESCIRAGLKYDADVIRWWLGQSEKARMALLDPPPVPLFHALDSLDGVFKVESPELIWSYGTDFDIAILRAAYRGSGRAEPWHRRMIRDARTLTLQVVTQEEMKGTRDHMAGSDCRKQIEWLIAAKNRLEITLK